MTIAIDLDNTWTADVHAWVQFYHFMTSRGHQVIMATARQKWTDDMERFSLPKDMPIVYCWGGYKEQSTQKAGYRVDVWIDDMPGMIQPTALLANANDDEL